MQKTQAVVVIEKAGQPIVAALDDVLRQVGLIESRLTSNTVIQRADACGAGQSVFCQPKGTLTPFTRQ